MHSKIKRRREKEMGELSKDFLYPLTRYNRYENTVMYNYNQKRTNNDRNKFFPFVCRCLERKWRTSTMDGGLHRIKRPRYMQSTQTYSAFWNQKQIRKNFWPSKDSRSGQTKKDLLEKSFTAWITRNSTIKQEW